MLRQLTVLMVACCLGSIARSQQPPGNVDLYGDPLPKFAVSRLGTTRLRHGGNVGDLRFSADGQLLTSWSDSHLYVWEADTGKLLRRENLTGLFSLRLSKEAILVGDLNVGFEKLKTWSFTDLDSEPPPPRMTNPNQVFMVNEPQSNTQILDYAMSPDGKVLATHSYSSERPNRRTEVNLWQFLPGKKVTELAPLDRKWRLEDDIVDLRFSGDGTKLLAIANIESDAEVGTIKIIVCNAVGSPRAQMIEIPKPTEFNGRALDVAPNSQSFVTASKDRKLRLFNFKSSTPLQTIAVPKVKDDHTNEVIVLRYSPDGDTIAVAGTGNRIWLWDIDAEKIVMQMDGHKSWVETLAFSPDGKTLASGGQDGVVHLWDVATGKRKNPLPAHEYWVLHCAISPDGKLAATSCADGTTGIWDASTGKRIHLIKHRSEWATCCEFIPNTKLLATTELQRLQIHDIESKEVIWESQPLNGMRSYFRELCLSESGLRFAAAINEGTVRVWERAGEKVNLIAEFGNMRKGETIDVDSLRFSPDGKSIAIGTSTNKAGSTLVEFWDVETSQKIRGLALKKGSAKDICFSSDGELFATSGNCTARGWTADNRDLASPGLEDSLVLWNTVSGKPIRKFALPETENVPYRRTRAVRFTADDKFLVSAERDGSLLIYRVATGEAVAVLQGHVGDVHCLAMSNDGRRCVTAGSDKTGIVWDVGAVLDSLNASQ